MVRIAVEVADGTTYYEVAVQAESIRRALKIVPFSYLRSVRQALFIGDRAHAMAR